MKVLLGLVVFIGGIALALWLGIWVMLAGGIIGAINAAQIGSASGVAWNIIRALFFEFGIIAGILVSIVGAGILSNS